MAIDNPKSQPFFKHVRTDDMDVVMFSDGRYLCAMEFADFEVARANENDPEYPALDADATGREYVPSHKHVQTFESTPPVSDRSLKVYTERGGGSVNDDALDAYIANLGESNYTIIN